MSELRILCLLFLLSFCGYSQAQNPIQFSGLVVSGDSLSTVPYANILIQNKQLGTISNFNGFFSFVAEAGDTLVFSCIGYQKETFIIPSDYDEKSLVHIQHLENATNFFFYEPHELGWAYTNDSRRLHQRLLLEQKMIHLETL